MHVARITKEKFKTYKNVFDAFTERTLFKLVSEGHFDALESPICIGKEANVFSAIKGSGKVIVKIYRLENCDFNRMYDYIKSDSRYISIKKSRRGIIFNWTQREFRNLLKARSVSVRVPTPIKFMNNILVMEYIGDTAPAPKLKDSIPKDPKKFFDKIIEYMKILHDSGLVHGDLSQFNILNYNENPVFIDMSQSTTLRSSISYELLVRDIKNISSFFSKQGITADPKKIISTFEQKV